MRGLPVKCVFGEDCQGSQNMLESMEQIKTVQSPP